MMDTIDRELERVLTLLRNKIRERGYTQLSVQAELGWGRSYISQLLTRQKCLRMEQVLLILGVIGIHPAEFFAELYLARPYGAEHLAPTPGAVEAPVASSQGLRDLRALVHRLADCLIEKELITAEDLASASGEDPG
ncbi:MAG: helix-turn-helix transcriptional regulator [bacterium]|nr:helix-turn-helix transcriptional regulator [bacterium]